MDQKSRELKGEYETLALFDMDYAASQKVVVYVTCCGLQAGLTVSQKVLELNALAGSMKDSACLDIYKMHHALLFRTGGV